MRRHALASLMVLRSVGMYVCMVVGLASGRDGHAGRDMHLHHFGGLVVVKVVVEWVG